MQGNLGLSIENGKEFSMAGTKQRKKGVKGQKFGKLAGAWNKEFGVTMYIIRSHLKHQRKGVI